MCGQTNCLTCLFILHQFSTRPSSSDRPCRVGSRRANPQTVRTCAVRLAAGTHRAVHCSAKLCAYRMQPARAQRGAAVPVRLLMHPPLLWMVVSGKPSPSMCHAPGTPADARAARRTCGMPRRSTAVCGTCTSPGTSTPSALPHRSTCVQVPALADLKVIAGLFAVSCNVFLHAHLCRDCREPRGIAFIEFAETRDAEDALAGLDRKYVEGREVSLQECFVSPCPERLDAMSFTRQRCAFRLLHCVAPG